MLGSISSGLDGFFLGHVKNISGAGAGARFSSERNSRRNTSNELSKEPCPVDAKAWAN